MNTLIILYIISIINSFQCENIPIIIPFKKKYNLNSSLNKTEVINIIGKNVLKTDILVGTPPKKLVFNIDTNSQFTYILTNNTVFEYKEPKDYIGYDPNISQTYRIINKTNVLADIFDDVYYIKENIIIQNRNFPDFNLLEPLFIYDSPDLTEDNCLLGLGLISYIKYSEIPANFIKTLKDKNIINNYNFFFDYINETDGLLVIGTTPNEYNNKKYPKPYNIFSRLPTSDRSVRWGFSIDKIYYNNKEFVNLKATCNIKVNYGYIDFGSALFNELTYLKELIKNNICTSEGIYTKTYVCNRSKFDKKKFGIIKLYNSQFNNEFILDLSLLFLDVGNYSYFLIRKCSTDYLIILGEPFLKNYTMLFNQDTKLIYYYGNAANNKISTNTILLIVLMCLLFLIINIVVVIILVKGKNVPFCDFVFRRKKKKGIEMSDDANYSAITN